MNSPAKVETQTEAMQLAEMQTGEIMMNAPLLAQIDQMAARMANAKATIPEHLRNNEGDCWAIIMQSIQWGMNPYVVAQKTHLVSGKLGYEAQLVNAVVQNSGMIDGVFRYEYQGEGEKMQCRVGAVIKGDTEITWNEWLTLEDVKIRNSPLWKTNQKQQIGYLQLKNWSRQYAPGPILGVYTPDEIPTSEQVEREIGPASSDLNDALKPVETFADEDVIEAELVEEDAADEEESPLTFAIVADAINKAKDVQALQVVGNNIVPDFLNADGNEQYRAELMDLYKARGKELQAIADQQNQ